MGDIEVLHNVMINNKNGDKIYIEPKDFMVLPPDLTLVSRSWKCWDEAAVPLSDERCTNPAASISPSR